MELSQGPMPRQQTSSHPSRPGTVRNHVAAHSLANNVADAPILEHLHNFAPGPPRKVGMKVFSKPKQVKRRLRQKTPALGSSMLAKARSMLRRHNLKANIPETRQQPQMKRRRFTEGKSSQNH